MKKLSALVIFVVLLFAATSAFAVPSGNYENYIGLYLDDGQGNTAFVLSSTGVASFNGALGLGSWIVNVSTVITYPVIGTQAVPMIDLNSLNVTSSSGGTLKIYASVAGFVASTGGNYVFDVGGTTSGSVTYAAYWDYVPGYLFGLNNQLFSQAITNSPFSATYSGYVPQGAVDYTLFAQITQESAGATSFDIDYKVPEPTSLVLLGLGLLGIAGIRRKH